MLMIYLLCSSQNPEHFLKFGAAYISPTYLSEVTPLIFAAHIFQCGYVNIYIYIIIYLSTCAGYNVVKTYYYIYKYITKKGL